MREAYPTKTKRTERLTFFLSLGTSAFWAIGQVTDIYQFPVVGAIYELLWLPFLILVFGIPLASIFFWAKEKFKIRSLFLPSILISIFLLGWMILS
jgi:hypothetical protein